MRKEEVFKMPSGAELHVWPAEFVNAGALMQAVLKQLTGLKLRPEDFQKDLSELRDNPSGLMPLVDKVLSLAASDELKNAVFDCCSLAKYSPKANAGMIAVDKALFDDNEFGMQAREDYYTIMYRVVEVNCKPFFVKTFSGLLAQRKQSAPAHA